ncbi:DUF1559 family PulG-like putative transporter [Roseiconus lacunae]|uniref:DUF1559 domain-containing protein n=1 Tax=Roseiconus lacunae TaxID=2605694 RepID=A0ABT7PM51_9BACT|nr:DUF1559 domain-containing protein [Roseiconus lacunae]MCD0460838.1 DUF1559 domain-containing protein [Roseiconus lacunae]MDM4017408.1 DUF1559 domain-containing protein [Roseiconus lacunae]
MTLPPANRTLLPRRYRQGITLIEVLLVVAIGLVILILLTMRLSSTRESSRRIECESNLREIAVATQSYSLIGGHLPTGTQNPTGPIRSESKGYHHNWLEALLPMLDQQDLFDQIDFSYGVYAAANRPVGEESLTTLRCGVSASTLRPNATTYAGVVGSVAEPIDEDGDGMFALNRWRMPSDAVDGESYVFLFGEKAIDFGPPQRWNSGTRASLRHTGFAINAHHNPAPSDPKALGDVDNLFVGSFSSNHIGGAYFAFVDGSFRFFSADTDQRLLQDLAARDNAPQDNAPPE